MFAKALLFCALAACAAAQSPFLSFTRVPNPVTDGEPQAITYATNDTQSPVTILLRKGPSSNLQTVEVLTKNAVGGQFIWTPPVTLANGQDYALEITQGSQVNYYGPFSVQGANYASISASTASSSTKNSTTTMAGGASNGTATATSGNSTMGHTTMTSNSSSSSTSATKSSRHSPTHNMASSTGAGFQSTATSGSGNGNGGASPTGNGASDFTSQSSLALAFGALAAILYLY